MQIVTLREMFEAGVHFGHQTRYWNPKMAEYIFGSKQKVHIINLDKTLPLFHEALKFISQVAAKNGKILFVGTKKAAQDIIRDEAIRCGMPYINYRWLGGMLTNYKTIRQSVKHFKELEALRDSGRLEDFSKKEALGIMREIVKMERNLGGIKNMNGLPDVIFVIDVGHEKIAINEANKLSIPVVGVVDTNHDPKGIDHIIPGNDDAIRAIQFYTKHLADVIIEARKDIVEAQRIAEQKAEKTIKKEIRPKQKVQTKKIVVKEASEIEHIEVEKVSKEKEVHHEVLKQPIKTHKEPIIKIAAKKEVSTKTQSKSKRKTVAKKAAAKTSTKSAKGGSK
jgi:small subunit ribosomal protein S2